MSSAFLDPFKLLESFSLAVILGRFCLLAYRLVIRGYQKWLSWATPGRLLPGGSAVYIPVNLGIDGRHRHTMDLLNELAAANATGLGRSVALIQTPACVDVGLIPPGLH